MIVGCKNENGQTSKFEYFVISDSPFLNEFRTFLMNPIEIGTHLETDCINVSIQKNQDYSQIDYDSILKAVQTCKVTLFKTLDMLLYHRFLIPDDQEDKTFIFTENDVVEFKIIKNKRSVRRDLKIITETLRAFEVIGKIKKHNGGSHKWLEFKDPSPILELDYINNGQWMCKFCDLIESQLTFNTILPESIKKISEKRIYRSIEYIFYLLGVNKDRISKNNKYSFKIETVLRAIGIIRTYDYLGNHKHPGRDLISVINDFIKLFGNANNRFKINLIDKDTRKKIEVEKISKKDKTLSHIKMALTLDSLYMQLLKQKIKNAKSKAKSQKQRIKYKNANSYKKNKTNITL